MPTNEENINVKSVDDYITVTMTRHEAEVLNQTAQGWYNFYQKTIVKLRNSLNKELNKRYE